MEKKVESHMVSLPSEMWKMLQERKRIMGVPVSQQIRIALEKVLEYG
ncbi:MAG: hypothetical protein QXF56_00905 [Candidatus Micrarchaeia archaeon]